MPNIKDVAAKAGVSLSTVSIVINNKAEDRKISRSTQEKVQRAIADLGYTPNISAKKLKSGAKNSVTIALFWTFDFRRGMITRFFSGLQSKIQKDSSNINIVIYPYTGDKLCDEILSFTQGYFHAAIIANATQKDIEFLETNNFSVPIVLYNRFSEHFSSVNMDDDKIGELSAMHLFEHGYRKPALISSQANFPGAKARRNAFIDAMAGKKIPIKSEDIFDVSNSVKGGYTWGIDNINLTQKNGYDSFFCDSDSIALGLQSAFLSMGIKVPQTFGIIAIGNGERQQAEFSYPSLSVVDIPLEDMAYGCCDLIKKQLDDRAAPKEHIYFETALHARASTDRTGIK